MSPHILRHFSKVSFKSGPFCFSSLYIGYLNLLGLGSNLSSRLRRTSEKIWKSTNFPNFAISWESTFDFRVLDKYTRRDQDFPIFLWPSSAKHNIVKKCPLKKTKQNSILTFGIRWEHRKLKVNSVFRVQWNYCSKDFPDELHFKRLIRSGVGILSWFDGKWGTIGGEISKSPNYWFAHEVHVVMNYG